MKKIVNLIALLVLSCILFSCADTRTFVIKGKETTVEPYGWANASEMKNEAVIYEPCVGNIVWSVIFSETIVVPVWLTGWELYEAKEVKAEYILPDTAVPQNQRTMEGYVNQSKK